MEGNSSGFAATGFLSAATVPAICIDRRDRITAVSPQGQVLVHLWQADAGNLKKIATQVRASGLPAEVRLTPVDGSRFWVVVAPKGRDCLLVSRDTTVPDRITEALMKSRSLLKQLLDNSVSLAFELDERGRFRFLTPDVVFGQAADVWIGGSARSFFWTDGSAPLRSPLTATSKKRFEAVEVALPGGQKRFLDFDIEPKLDASGKVVSLLGSCRDMTEQVETARKTKALSRRLQVQKRITDVLNGAATADALLSRAAEVLRELLRAETAWMLVDHGRALIPACMVGDEGHNIDLKAAYEALDTAGETGLCSLRGPAGEALAVTVVPEEGQRGMLVLDRDTSVNPWSEQEKELLMAVGGLVSAAFGKALLFDRIYRLSSQDELTGCLNRRALVDYIEKRLRHYGNTGGQGALLFIDLDHFKQVNDILGHDAGDAALALTAKKISGFIRPADEIGRYGGDEFIVWLEGVDEEEAVKKASDFLALIECVRQELAARTGAQEALNGAPLKLGASIGVALAGHAQNETFDELAKRADTALYEVKRAGRGQLSVAKATS